MAIEYHCDTPSGEARTVNSESHLARIAKTASAGDWYKIGGNFDNDVVWRADGTKEAPIHLDFSAAKMKNMKLTIEGNWIRVCFGDWRNSQVAIEGHHNRVTRCHFHHGKTGGNSAHFNSAAQITRGASYNRIDHCLVENWIGRAIRQNRMTKDAKDNIMDHNHMRRMSDGDNRNGREAMQIGSGHNEMTYGNMNTHIICNLIEDYDQESEAISIKANGNTISDNTIEDCRISYIVCRSGSRNLFAANWIQNARGIIIYGDDNVVVDNVMVGSNPRCELGIRSGDCNVEQLKQGKFVGGHPAARNTISVGNQVAIGEQHQIGEWGRGKKEYYDEQWLPASNTSRFDNQGALTTEGRNFKESGTKELDSYSGARFIARRLTKDDVGLHAPDPFCDDNGGGEPDTPVDEAYKLSQETLAAHQEAHRKLGEAIEAGA